ncbi:MAG TPA: ATP-binding protein [Polyangiaceae bacterium]|nr:ATP-binding protein [Polyangiaceae bacterium]
MLRELQIHALELQMQNEALSDMQRELEAAKDRFRDLFEFAPVAYLTVKGDGTIDTANQAAGELFGVPPRELSGQRFSRFVAPEEAEAFERHRREVVDSTGRLRAEITFTAADESPRELRLESTCTNPTTGEWRTALVDLTHAKALARRIEHADRLEAIGIHVSGIAHDFNNLLSSMLGYASLALSALEPRHPAHRQVQKLYSVATRGGNALKQLSEFARAERAEPSLVDLNRYLTDMVPLFTSLVGKGVDVRVRLDAADATVRAHVTEIEQALLNLIVNANHAMPNGGRLTLETALVNVPRGEHTEDGERMYASFVCLTVDDNGTGMDDRTRHHALEPFFTTKPKGAGTGLGLTLAQHVMERAGGWLELESVVGSGTRVKLLFPRAACSERIPTSRPPRLV